MENGEMCVFWGLSKKIDLTSGKILVSKYYASKYFF